MVVVVSVADKKAVVEHKVCSCCKREKPLNSFPSKKRNGVVVGVRTICKECINIKQREWRAQKSDYSTSAPTAVKRENSLGVARPIISKFLAPDEVCDIFSISRGSAYKVQLECPYCGARKKIRANALSKPDYPLCNKCVVDSQGNLVSTRPSNLLVDVSPEAELWWNDERDVRTVTAGSKYRAKWKCPDCGDTFVKPVIRFKPKCDCQSGNRPNSLLVRAPWLESEFSEDNTIDISSLTYSSAKKVIWVCNKGHSWKASVYQRVLQKSGCPHCSCSGTSSAEKELRDYVINQVGEESVVANDTATIFPQELDVYIPSRGIAIEYNGLYWHGERCGKERNYHRDKAMACKNAGVQLITVWEDEWLYQQSAVKHMITHKLGVSKQRRVFARQTKVVELTAQQAREFCERYHIQGFVQGGLYAGLVDGAGDLVAVSVWRKNGVHAYLERYCTSQVVVGGMGKLLAHGLSWAQNKGISQIVTFADLCVSNGDLYEKLGFTKDKILRPDYKYVVNDRRVHKFNYRKKRFKEDLNLVWQDGLSESELAILNGIDRVWDCGKIRYTLQV